MNAMQRYTFKSVTGRTVTVKSRMGEEAARMVAMRHFWGPPTPPTFPGNGTGLDLVLVEEM